MKTVTKYLLISLISLGSWSLHGQDLHYTQFHEMPVYLNPAYTGHINGTYRAVLIYRSQWSSIVPNAFVSPGLSFDANIAVGKGGSSFGVGLLALNDQTGNGVFNAVHGALSVAYHLALDRNQQHFLSIGGQGGLINKRLNTSDITFASQFDGFEINPNVATGETFGSTSVMNPDLGAGLTWSSYFGNKFNFKLGGAFLHLIEAKEEFLSLIHI